MNKSIIVVLLIVIAGSLATLVGLAVKREQRESAEAARQAEIVRLAEERQRLENEAGKRIAEDRRKVRAEYGY